MADYTQTAADVNLVTSGGTEVVTAGAAISAGQPYYKDSNGQAQLCDADGDSDTAGIDGIALCDVASGQKVVGALPGSSVEIDMGITFTVGDVVVLSGTAGAYAPVADLASGDFVTIVGVAKTANNIIFDPNVSGIQVA